MPFWYVWLILVVTVRAHLLRKEEAHDALIHSDGSQLAVAGCLRPLGWRGWHRGFQRRWKERPAASKHGDRSDGGLVHGHGYGDWRRLRLSDARPGLARV